MSVGRSAVPRSIYGLRSYRSGKRPLGDFGGRRRRARRLNRPGSVEAQPPGIPGRFTLRLAYNLL